MQVRGHFHDVTPMGEGGWVGDETGKKLIYDFAEIHFKLALCKKELNFNNFSYQNLIRKLGGVNPKYSNIDIVQQREETPKFGKTLQLKFV